MDIIKDLLLHHYPNHIGYNDKTSVVYPCVIKTSDFSLRDSKACVNQGCGDVENCDHIVITIKTTTPVAVLEFETFVNQFGNTVDAMNGDRCDFLLYDPTEAKSRIALCELTCGDAKYIEPNTGRYPEGKRAHAYYQIKNSLEHLLSIPVLDQNILTYVSHYGVFGWREKMGNVDDKVLESMANFSDTPSSNELILYTQDYVLDHGFVFVQVKYPTALNWNEDINTSLVSS